MSETVTLYKCDKCKGLIKKPEDGVVVHGNIYMADPNEQGGLIGNNFPDTNKDRWVTEDAIKKSVYCQGCFLKIVFPKLKVTQTRGFFDEEVGPVSRDPHNINGDR